MGKYPVNTMRLFLFFCLLCFYFGSTFGQDDNHCEQLAIAFHGIVASEEGDQLFFEVSNARYAGHLYYYPGFLLISELGDTIAREETKYYGIGTSFQTHLLNVEADISFPFKGRLELYGSYYQNFFCGFPIEIEDADYVELDDFEEQEVKVAPTYAGDHIIVDLGGVPQAEVVRYEVEITDDRGYLKYSSPMETELTAIPVKEIGGSGMYLVNVWDAIKEIWLPSEPIFLD